MRPARVATIVLGLLLMISGPLAAEYGKGDDPLKWSQWVDLDSGVDVTAALHNYDPGTGDYLLWGVLDDDEGRLQMASELTTIPEPASMAILGTALLTAVGVIRRRRMPG